MVGMIQTGTSEPWDPYMGADVKADILPSVLAEGTVDGKLYNWPIFLDIIVQAWNARLVEKAGLDPSVAPTTWDESSATLRRSRTAGSPRSARRLTAGAGARSRR